MKIKVTSYSSQSSLLSSIIFFIIGAILFTKAETVLNFISLTIGIIIMIAAITQLIFVIFEIKGEEPVKKLHVLSTIITFLISIIFIFFPSIVEKSISYLVGAWILFSGIMRFINCLSISPKNKKFLPLVIVSFLLMATGIYTIVVDNVILKTTGLIMMIYSIIEIIGYIFYTKDTMQPEEPGTTTLIVQDKETNDDNEKENKIVKTVKDSKPKKVTKKKDSKSKNTKKQED